MIKAISQQTFIYKQPEADYNMAIELFSKEKYGPAKELFSKVIENISNPESELRINAQYYYGLCALEQFNPDAQNLITRFITEHPENIKANIANFQMGRIEYRNKNFDKATTWFDKVDAIALQDVYLSEFYFKKGYSHFMIEDYDLAKKCFVEVKDSESKYKAPANYYYGHIEYLQKNYETAFNTLNKLKEDATFGPIVPYYITHIYYLQGKYEEVIKYAPPVLDSASTKRAPEIARLIGNSYFELKKYQEALPFYEKFITKAANINRQDYYQFGYTYYKVNQATKAIENFEKVVGVEDSLSQNAYYYLGDVYIINNQKKQAREAFKYANKLAYNKTIEEDALFNFAKLSYELSMNPYNEAISSFQQYIEKYPNSTKLDEAKTYLMEMFLTTNNYKDALASIENIKDKSYKFKVAYQKIAYFRGVELFNNNQMNEAIEMFNKSLSLPVINSVTSEAYYWKAESYYRLAKYDTSLINYDKFLLSDGAFSLPIYSTAHYNMGYAYFLSKDYEKANYNFRKFITYNIENKRMLSDAYLRIGDCYFVLKEYQAAFDNYDNSQKMNIQDVDYAIFQKSLVYGALGKLEDKINLTKTLLDKYPKSNYIDDAKFEMGNTYMIENQNDKALLYYNKIINEHKTSSFVKKSLLNIGLIQFNNDQNDASLATLKKVVANYPNSVEAKEALFTIRNIYVEKNNVDEFINYTSLAGIANISNSEQDSITYIAAENSYMNGDCDNSVKSFTNYLSKFPDGYFTINANFYKAECSNKSSKTNEALHSYLYVLRQGKSKFSEKSAYKVSQIYYKQKMYDSALVYYTQLGSIAEFKSNQVDAKIGIMRCNYQLENYQNAISYANMLLKEEKVSAYLINECNITIARSAFATDSLSLASTYYGITAKQATNELGAESKYQIAYILFKQKNYVQSEKVIFELADKFNSYELWKAKGFILLADIYLAKNNIFQAKHTLQSVIDNYDGADLIKIAQDKLNEISKLENNKPNTNTNNDVELDFSGK